MLCSLSKIESEESQHLFDYPETFFWRVMSAHSSLERENAHQRLGPRRKKRKLRRKKSGLGRKKLRRKMILRNRLGRVTTLFRRRNGKGGMIRNF